MTEFRGVYTALITPMTATHELNEDVLRKIVEFNIGAGIDGFWVAGGSGESILLDDDENGRIAEIVTQQSNGRAKIIMHVGAPTTKRAPAFANARAKSPVPQATSRTASSNSPSSTASCPARARSSSSPPAAAVSC